jgi:tRNA nucleotidyltransferase (CCA-adding enzyme)
MNTSLHKVKEIVSILIKDIPVCSPVSVGGSVRDALMFDQKDILAGFEHYTKDFDLEVFHAQPPDVLHSLTNVGISVELVGRAFPVYKVKGYEIDIAFPRIESKTGEKHTDFNIKLDPELSFREASLRRDFTVNAMGYEWKTGQLLDEFGGRQHLEERVLHPVSEKFKEDALRVLRAFKFIARYGFKPTDTCINMSREMIPELAGFARERIMGEWNDFILKGEVGFIEPAFEFLWKTGVIYLYPELEAIKYTPQDPRHHPEGDVLKHTVFCLEHYISNVRSLLQDINDKLVVGYAVLTHDFGKANCTIVWPDHEISSHGHEDDKAARQFMERVFDPADQRIEDIVKLVQAHMRPVMLYNSKSSMKAIRRLVMAVDGRMDRLYHIVACDLYGRPPAPADLSPIIWLREKQVELNLSDQNKIKPIIQGRHLIEYLGMTPGPSFKPILNDMFESQLDGDFDNLESGIAILKLRHGK